MFREDDNRKDEAVYIVAFRGANNSHTGQPLRLPVWLSIAILFCKGQPSTDLSEHAGRT